MHVFSHASNEAYTTVAYSKVKYKNEVTTEWVTTESTYQLADISLQNYDWKLEPTRFSSWPRLVSIQAWVHCFINNLYGKI